MKVGKKSNFKKGIKLLLLFLFIVGISSCELITSEKNNVYYASGIVRYIPIEGGFYGIITAEEKNFDPVNLKASFQQDSLRVFFTYKIAKEQASFHMWGTLIEIIDIAELTTGVDGL